MEQKLRLNPLAVISYGIERQKRGKYEGGEIESVIDALADYMYRNNLSMKAVEGGLRFENNSRIEVEIVADTSQAAVNIEALKNSLDELRKQKSKWWQFWK